MAILNKSPLKIGENEAWAYPGTVQIFLGTPIISGTGREAQPRAKILATAFVLGGNYEFENFYITDYCRCSYFSY